MQGWFNNMYLNLLIAACALQILFDGWLFSFTRTMSPRKARTITYVGHQGSDKSKAEGSIQQCLIRSHHFLRTWMQCPVACCRPWFTWFKFGQVQISYIAYLVASTLQRKAAGLLTKKGRKVASRGRSSSHKNLDQAGPGSSITGVWRANTTYTCTRIQLGDAYLERIYNVHEIKSEIAVKSTRLSP